MSSVAFGIQRFYPNVPVVIWCVKFNNLNNEEVIQKWSLCWRASLKTWEQYSPKHRCYNLAIAQFEIGFVLALTSSKLSFTAFFIAARIVFFLVNLLHILCNVWNLIPIQYQSFVVIIRISFLIFLNRYWRDIYIQPLYRKFNDICIDCI